MEFEDFYFKDEDAPEEGTPFHKLSDRGKKELAADMLKDSKGFVLFRVDKDGNLGYAINASDKSAQWYGLINFAAQALGQLSGNRTAGFLREGFKDDLG